MDSKTLVVSILQRNNIHSKTVNESDGTQSEQTYCLLSNKQGGYLASLLSREGKIKSSTKGKYRQSGDCMEFYMDGRQYLLFEPAKWYGNKGLYKLLLP